jgi:hypothetical protein
MGKYVSAVEDHLLLPARAMLTPGQEQQARLRGQPIPGPVSVRLVIDTGSKRSTLLPGIIRQLNPISRGAARVETGLASLQTSLYWVRLDFPGTPLAAVPELAVARMAMPPSLSSFHGVIGRDLVRRWESVLFEGRRGRLTIRDMPGGLSGWLLR